MSFITKSAENQKLFSEKKLIKLINIFDRLAINLSHDRKTAKNVFDSNKNLNCVLVKTFYDHSNIERNVCVLKPCRYFVIKKN